MHELIQAAQEVLTSFEEGDTVVELNISETFLGEQNRNDLMTSRDWPISFNDDGLLLFSKGVVLLGCQLAALVFPLEKTAMDIK